MRIITENILDLSFEFVLVFSLHILWKPTRSLIATMHPLQTGRLLFTDTVYPELVFLIQDTISVSRVHI